MYICILIYPSSHGPASLSAVCVAFGPWSLSSSYRVHEAGNLNILLYLKFYTSLLSVLSSNSQ